MRGAHRSGRGRSNGSGGIRKRGPVRADRDGDLNMDATGGRDRGAKRSRQGSSRSTPDGGHSRDKTLNAIQQAVWDNNTSNANVRHGKRGGGNLAQVSVRGLRQSKAASNSDGGVESLTAFLEKKISTHYDPKAGPRPKISKVCATTNNM